MIHFRRFTLALCMFLFVVPLGILSGILRTISGALDVVTNTLVMFLNWIFAGEDTEIAAALEFINNHVDNENEPPTNPPASV